MSEHGAATSRAGAPGEGAVAATVLVADPQVLFAQALGRALARQPGLEVVEPYPRSGVDATQAAVILRPKVAVLDLWLTGVTALAATRTIVAGSPGTRVVVLGWFHEAEDIRQVLDAGASGFVSKERPLADVVEVIERVAAGEGIVIDPNFRVRPQGFSAAKSGEGGQAEAGEGGQTEAGEGEAFTPRELEVLRLLGAGLPVEDVAARLDIARKTARSHLDRIRVKTGASSQLRVLAVARERGYLV